MPSKHSIKKLLKLLLKILITALIIGTLLVVIKILFLKTIDEVDSRTSTPIIKRDVFTEEMSMQQEALLTSQAQMLASLEQFDRDFNKTLERTQVIREATSYVYKLKEDI